MRHLRRRLRFSTRDLASNEVVCQICGRVFPTRLNYTHLKKHGITFQDHKSSYRAVQIFSRDFSKRMGRLSSARMKEKWETKEWQDFMHPIQVKSGKKTSKMIFSDPKYAEFVKEWKASGHPNFTKEDWKDPEYRERMREPCRKGGSTVFTYLWHSDDKKAVEFRRKRIECFSRRAADRVVNGDLTRASMFMCGHFNSKKNKSRLYFRSSYEERAFELLEEDDQVIRYEVEPFKIEYVSDKGIKRYYVPDILVYYDDGSIKLVEVKPEVFIKARDSKYIAAQHYCRALGYTFVFWSEQQLFGGY